MKISENIGNI